MSNSNEERQGRTWNSDIVWVLIYSATIAFFMLWTATIPA
jgi:hypothetical protein